jgi:hypothetical protein
MKNPIPHSNLFVTPDSFEELLSMTENCTANDNERRLVYLGAMMALNLSHKLVEELHVKEGV